MLLSSLKRAHLSSLKNKSPSPWISCHFNLRTALNCLTHKRKNSHMICCYGGFPVIQSKLIVILLVVLLFR